MRFGWHHFREWYRGEIWYQTGTASCRGWLLLPSLCILVQEDVLALLDRIIGGTSLLRRRETPEAGVKDPRGYCLCVAKQVIVPSKGKMEVWNDLLPRDLQEGRIFSNPQLLERKGRGSSSLGVCVGSRKEPKLVSLILADPNSASLRRLGTQDQVKTLREMLRHDEICTYLSREGGGCLLHRQTLATGWQSRCSCERVGEKHYRYQNRVPQTGVYTVYILQKRAVLQHQIRGKILL